MLLMGRSGLIAGPQGGILGEVAAPDEPFICLVRAAARRRGGSDGVVEEDADDVRHRPTSRLTRWSELVLRSRTSGHGEGGEGEQVGRGGFEQLSDLRRRPGELVEDLAEPGAASAPSAA